MINFQKVETAVAATYDYFEADNEKGVASAFFTTDENMALVLATAVDGTPDVNTYMIILKNYLPANYSIGHNSPTDGCILITAEDKPSPFDPQSHKNRFKKQALEYINAGLPCLPQYRTAILYLRDILETTVHTAEEIIEGLQPNEEFLDQLIKLQHGYPMSQQLVTEEMIRKAFNWTFSQLDKNITGGTIFVGDNGSFLLRYYSVTESEQAFLIRYLKSRFSCLINITEQVLEFEIC